MPTTTPDTAAESRRVSDYVAGYTGEDNRDEQQRQQEARDAELQKIQRLGNDLLKKREEAMQARQQCGIEQDWEEDEEFYLSIDRANPEGETNVGKPVSSDGGPIGIAESIKNAGRSSVFIPITRPYVDSAYAKVADMLLPTDEWPFDFTCTPVPTQATALSNMKAPAGGAPSPLTAAIGMLGPALQAPQDDQPAAPMGAANPMGMSPATGAVAGPAAPVSPGASGPGMGATGASDDSDEDEDPAAVPGTPAADPKHMTADELACARAKQYITDWLTECQFHGEYRKMLENAAKLGTGILKGPVPQTRISQKMAADPATGEQRLVRTEETVPVSVSIDPRNFFPDPGCGEDVQKGSYTWEYDAISGRRVQEFKHDASYIPEQIDKVLREGPKRNAARPNLSPQADRSADSLVRSTFDIWYFYGMVDAETLEAAGIDPADLPPPPDGDVPDLVPAIVTIINDTVVKCALTPMDAGGFPYDVMPWQRRAGMIWGMGIARQMRTPQRMLNGAARALMDNAAFSSGPIIGIREDWIRNATGKRIVKPREVFLMTKNAPDNAKIGDAITAMDIPSVQTEMENLMNLAIHLAEVATGLPMIIQGQQGENQETATGRTIQNNNGSAVLRRIARQSDDCVMERHIRRYYQYLLENTDYDDAKGDLQIDCSASTALVDREISNQTLVQLAPMLYEDPDVSRTRLNQEMLRAHRFDPKRIYKTPAEKRRDAENAKNAPPPPEVMLQLVKNKGAAEVATINAGAKEKLGMAELEQALHTTLAQIASDREQADGANRTKLADSVMKLRAMLAMWAGDKQHDARQRHVDRVHEFHTSQVLTPPVEPEGRAPAGEAFEA